MNALVFEVTQEADGGFVAECLTEAIFTQADNWDSLRSNVREAVAAFLPIETSQHRFDSISSATKFSPQDEAPPRSQRGAAHPQPLSELGLPADRPGR